MPSHSKIRLIWRTCFHIDGCVTVHCTDRSFVTGNFLAEKGLAALSIGLIYHSMALSQLQSRDTVPLTFNGNQVNVGHSLF
jgi:hypothetical protein